MTILPGNAALEILAGLCARSRTATILVDADGRILWQNSVAEADFSGTFCAGTGFQEAFSVAFERVRRLELDEQIGGPQPSDGTGAPGHEDIYRFIGSPERPSAIYRADSFVVGEASETLVLHILQDVSEELRLEDSFRLNLFQLESMKEIVDILYESLSTEEVIYIILVAVTSQIGFGFNRAFFLQARGERLKGRIGIGPSDHEDAGKIWSRLAAMNFSSLRDVYHDLIREGGVPDPRTQELATLMDFDLSELRTGNCGLAAALRAGKPTCLRSSDALEAVDHGLYELLGTDVLAIVPLVVRGELAGVIIADNFITRQPFKESDLNVLKTFAGYAGVALERSRLYDRLRRSVAELQSANDRLRTHQDKLLQVEKLSAVGELAARVSHEIRTPMVAIGGLARSLLQDIGGDPSMKERMRVIVSEVSRLERFLRDTLDFVKPREGKTEEIELEAELFGWLEPFRTELEEKSVRLEWEFPDRPLRCVSDRELIRHAFTNLVKNALEAIDSQGTLHVGLEREGLFGVIEIGDTGAGIPPEIRSRIFDPFFTTKPCGTGLGLAIVSQSVKGIGGRIELRRDERFSTLFRLSLPLEQVLVEREADVVEEEVMGDVFRRRL